MSAKPKTPAHDQLAVLDNTIAAAEARLRETGQLAREALAPMADVTAAEGAAWASGDEAAGGDARVERERLEREAETWRVRLTACDSAIGDARARRAADASTTTATRSSKRCAPRPRRRASATKARSSS